MKFADMEGKSLLSTIRKGSDPKSACWVCGVRTDFYDIEEKVYLCSEKCRYKHCDLCPLEHINTKLD